MSPLTVLLIPPSGDVALLVDEAGGGRVPWARQTWHEDYGSPDGGTWSKEWTIGDADTSHEPAPHTGLLLVLDGVPVAMGWDRVRTLLAAKLGLDPSGGVVIEPIRIGLRVRWILRTWDDESRTVTDDVDSLDLRDLAPAVAAILGARIVLLRDGREVTE